jgi:tetratricopeptide (TPR) repeat protein
VDRTDERDARPEVPAEQGVQAAPHDLTVISQPAAGPEEPYATARPARTTATDRVVVGDVPAQRPGFLPRPALLAQLNQLDERVPVVHVLTGPQGAGKSQLAAAYARARLAADWRLVAWVNAENPASLLAGLAAAADAAGLSGGGSGRSPADVSLALRHWLEADGDRCLLVFDDAEDPGVLRSFLPVRGRARVVITAADEAVADLGSQIKVDVFSAEEALALLNGRTGLGDEAGATAVAAELGYMPLALDQAAAVIAGQYMGYEAYLGRLRTSPSSDPPAGAGESYPPAVAEAISLSVEAFRLAGQAGVSAGVLEVMAVLAGIGVRRELLHAAGEAGALASDGRRVAAAVVDHVLEELAEQALLTFTIDGQSVIMHRLVARVIRAGLVRGDRLALVCRAAASVLESRAEALAGSQERPAVRDIPEHVAALLDNAGDADEELTRVLLHLRFWALYHLIELGDSALRAIALGEPLIADLDRVLGPDHPDSLNARNSLAAAYQAAGRTDEAIPLFEQTLVARVRLLGPDHPDALTSQNNLAATYQAAGRAVEAILMFRLTLAARERLLGADHPGTLNSCGNLAAAYRDAGRTAEAIPLFVQTVAGRERLLGPDHPDTLRSQSSLAAVYKAAGQAAEAIPLVEKILAARERALGASHPKTLSSRNNLAAVYREAGRAAEAVPMLEQTLAACERLLGAADPRTGAVRHNLLLARQEAEQAENAELVDQVGGDLQDEGP